MKSFLSTYIEFSDSEYELFISKAKLIRFKKNEFLLRANKSVEKMFFLKSGIIRGYRIIDGEDITHYFFIENWFATDFESFLTRNPGKLYLEAISDTTVYEFNRRTLFSFFEDFPKFEKIRIIQAEYAYLQMVERLREFQTENLKERYLNLISKNPKLFNLVSQKHIASYLGVAPQSLSRIKDIVRHA